MPSPIYRKLRTRPCIAAKPKGELKRSKGLIVGISGLFGSRLCGSIGGIYDRDWDVRRFLPFSLSKKILPPPFLSSRSVNLPSINGATTISQLWPVARFCEINTIRHMSTSFCCIPQDLCGRGPIMVSWKQLGNRAGRGGR